MGFTPPTGDVRDLAELTREVDRYVAEVTAYTRRMTAATVPTSGPAR